MVSYLLRRILGLIPTLLLVSVVAFAVIQLPPGDFVTSYVSNLAMQGDTVSQDALEGLRASYGLDQPLPVQYFKWISRILLHGDFGISFEHRESVSSLVWERIWLTMWLSLGSVVASGVVARTALEKIAVNTAKLANLRFTLIPLSV